MPFSLGKRMCRLQWMQFFAQLLISSRRICALQMSLPKKSGEFSIDSLKREQGLNVRQKIRVMLSIAFLYLSWRIVLQDMIRIANRRSTGVLHL